MSGLLLAAARRIATRGTAAADMAAVGPLLAVCTAAPDATYPWILAGAEAPQAGVH